VSIDLSGMHFGCPNKLLYYSIAQLIYAVSMFYSGGVYSPLELFSEFEI